MEVGSIEYIAKINTAKYKRGAKDIEKANRDMEGSTDKADQSTNKFGTSLRKFASRGVKVAAVGMAGLATTIATMTIKGGISRALNIEDAQAKLRGLGHDAESVETIMESALASVKGTAYGLDAAATAAASAVAAGVKPGQELTKYLSLAGDAATIAGVSFEEMGSIFGKVQTQQRAYTMEINQLADRGIPIYQWLQEELGVTQEALRKMVAAGEVDSATYFKVIEKNIGGAALESGKTTRGAWRNMLAAMSRVGERIVSGPIDRVRTGFGDMTKWIDNNSDAIVRVVEDILEVLIDFARTTGKVVVAIYKLRAPLAGIITAYGAYRLVVLSANTATSIQNVLIAATSTQLTGARLALLATTVAQKGLNLAMKMNPIGIVVGLLAGLITTLGVLRIGTDKQKTATDRLNDALKAGKVAADNLRTAEDNLKNARLEVEGSTLAVERAQRTYNETVKQYGPKSLEAREAAYALKTAEDRLKEANNQVKKATEEKTTAEKKNADARKEVSKAESAKRQEYERTSTAISGQRSELTRLGLAIDGINGKKATYQILGFSSAYDLKKAATGKGTPYAMPRYRGGPVTAGRAYLVGENRDGSLNDTSELFIPNTSGRIVSSKDLEDSISGNGGGGITNNIQNVTISSEVDGERWLRRLSGNQEIVSNGLVPTQSYM